MLKPGEYVATKVGCEGLGGAGSMSFDGRNFSGHYTVCHTVPVSGIPNHYSNTCVEGQGINFPKNNEIDTRDGTTIQRTIIVKSPTIVDIDGEKYGFCVGEQ
jgi:hypothetical protein